MAVPKDKVLTVLKEKLKGKSHTKTFIDKTAIRYAEKIETEEDIDTYVDDRLDDLLEAGAEADRRSTAAVDKAKKDAVTTITGKKENEETEEPADATDMQKLMKMVTGLSETVGKMQTEKNEKTITERFHNDPRLKGLSPKILRGYVPKTDDEFESAVEEAAEALKDFVSDDEEVVTQTVNTKPSDKPRVGGKPGGGSKAGEAKPATKEEIEAAASKLVI